MPQGEEGEQEERHLLATSAVPDAGETPPDTPDLSHLALQLIAELSVCVQWVSSDLAQASRAAADGAGDRADLESARQRWAQQLRTLAALAEGQHDSLLPSELPLSALPRIPVASPNMPADEQISREMPINPPLPASYRWVPLTAREREVLKLSQRGYSPRRIALRLTITVETVYTHTRNIRRKQRAWEQERRAKQQTQQAKQAPRTQHEEYEEGERLNQGEQATPAIPASPITQVSKQTRQQRTMRIAPTTW